MDSSLRRDRDDPSKGSQKEAKPRSAKDQHMLFTRQHQKDSNQAGRDRRDAPRQGWNVKKSVDVIRRDVKLQTILNKKRRVLPNDVKKILDTIIEYHNKDAQSQLSDNEYINACGKALIKLCPQEILDKYIRGQYENINKFVVDKQWDYAKSKSRDGKCMFYLPSKTDYPIDILLRCVDEALVMKYDKLLDNHQHFDADLKARVDITATVFEMNMEIGNKGWQVTKEYPLAYKYKEYYKKGISKAIKEGLMDKKIQEEIRKIGYKYAREQLRKHIEKLRKRSKSKNGVPDIFLNIQPGSYFREWDKFKKMEKEVKLEKTLQLAKDELDKLDEKGPIKVSEDSRTLSMMGPVKLGSIECEILLKFLHTRAEEVKKEGILAEEVEKKRILKVAILPNKEIWVLPYYFSKDGEKTTHSLAARGKPVGWAGEVDIAIDSEGNKKVIKLKGDSGHYLTYNSDSKKQQAIFDFAVSTFGDHRCDISGVTDQSLTGKRHAKRKVT